MSGPLAAMVADVADLADRAVLDDRAVLADLDNRTRPRVLAHQQRLAVGVSLSVLLPQGVQRGSTVIVGRPRNQGVRAAQGQGATSLALEFLAGTSGVGGWCAVVGLPTLGLVAAAQLGLRLERLALVPDPGAQWPVVAAALIDSVDVLLLVPPARATLRDARRLSARARERGAVLVVLDPSWPDRGDMHLAVGSVTWSGLEMGGGYLRARRVEVVLSGRGSAARERSAWMGLPGNATGLEGTDSNEPGLGGAGLGGAGLGGAGLGGAGLGGAGRGSARLGGDGPVEKAG